MEHSDVLRGLIRLGWHVARSLVRPQAFVRARLRVNGLQLSVRMKSLLRDRAFLSTLASINLPQSPSQISNLKASLDKFIHNHAKLACARVMDALSLAEDARRGWHIEQWSSGDYDWAKTSSGTWCRVYTHPTEHDVFSSRRFEITPQDAARGCRSLMFFYNKTTDTMSWDDPLRGISVGDMHAEWSLETTTTSSPVKSNASIFAVADAYANCHDWVDASRGASLYKLLAKQDQTRTKTRVEHRM